MFLQSLLQCHSFHESSHSTAFKPCPLQSTPTHTSAFLLPPALLPFFLKHLSPTITFYKMDSFTLSIVYALSLRATLDTHSTRTEERRGGKLWFVPSGKYPKLLERHHTHFRCSVYSNWTMISERWIRKWCLKEKSKSLCILAVVVVSLPSPFQEGHGGQTQQ